MQFKGLKACVVQHSETRLHGLSCQLAGQHQQKSKLR